jgi:UDP-N-acetylglucosamine 2-epimerase
VRRCEELGWQPTGQLHLTAAVGYLDLLTLLSAAHLVVTDSGGLMREAYFAAVPCVIPLEHTPWRELVETGWALEVGRDPERLAGAVASFAAPSGPPPLVFGDGQACTRVVRSLNELCAGPPDPTRFTPDP